MPASLCEAVMFDSAIKRASELTSEQDTLTIVTVDHSHVFSLGASIFGLAPLKALDGKSYTSILYGNGPGYVGTGDRPNVTAIESSDPTYRQQAAVPLSSETHGGEDVAIFARGPQAHLVHGVQEQSYIAHVMAFAGCLEPYTDCGLAPPAGSSATTRAGAPPPGPERPHPGPERHHPGRSAPPRAGAPPPGPERPHPGPERHHPGRSATTPGRSSPSSPSQNAAANLGPAPAPLTLPLLVGTLLLVGAAP